MRTLGIKSVGLSFSRLDVLRSKGYEAQFKGNCALNFGLFYFESRYEARLDPRGISEQRASSGTGAPAPEKNKNGRKSMELL